LRVLAWPHHQIAERLRGHRLRGTSLLRATVAGGKPHQVQQELTLQMDPKGSYSAVKNTDPQYGQEVVFDDGWLYIRLRHNPFIRRRPQSEREPRRIADRMVGLLPGYVDLLGRFISTSREGEVKLASGPAVKVRLGLATRPAALPAQRGRARQWRRFISVQKISGTVLFCARTLVPLKVDLRASWSFHPPGDVRGPSGIPRTVDRQSVGRMSLELKQQITDIGAQIAIKPPDPAQVRTNLDRQRLEVERQMLTGERPLTGRVDNVNEGDDGE